MTSVGVRAHPTLDEFVLADSETVPVKPFSGVMVMVELPGTFGSTVRVFGLAEIVKSGVARTWYVTVVEWERLLVEPVTVAR